MLLLLLLLLRGRRRRREVDIPIFMFYDKVVSLNQLFYPVFIEIVIFACIRIDLAKFLTFA